MFTHLNAASTRWQPSHAVGRGNLPLVWVSRSCFVRLWFHEGRRLTTRLPQTQSALGHLCPLECLFPQYNHIINIVFIIIIIIIIIDRGVIINPALTMTCTIIVDAVLGVVSVTIQAQRSHFLVKQSRQTRPLASLAGPTARLGLAVAEHLKLPS